jgi:hypothetical protein
MGMRTVRLVVVVLLIAAAGLVVGVPPAQAGGASFIMDRGWYEPGDRAVGRTGINWEHAPLLGAPEDGPYYAYLVPVASMALVTTWPTDPATLPGAVLVDVIEITEGPIEIVPGRRMGPHGATVEFAVPDLPDGQYALDHCNRPCTTSLADITGGGIWIGPPPPVAPLPAAPMPSNPPTTTSTTTTTTTPTTITTSTSTTDSDPDREGAAPAVAGGRGSGWPDGPLTTGLFLALPLLAVAGLGVVSSRTRLRVVAAHDGAPLPRRRC